MRVLLWHVHGGWTDAFVRGDHDYLLPTTAARDGWGLGRGGRHWPRTIEIAPDEIADAGVDVVVLQRPQELEVAERLLRRRPGRDVAAVYVEHNTPKGDVPNTVHPLADRDDIPVVHVTHTNALLWDSGRAPTVVVEHGVADPGHRYTGQLERIGVVINEPVRRWRVTGTDLLPRFARLAPVDVFGMGTDLLAGAFGGVRPDITPRGDVPPGPLHSALAERRLYLHPMRWTSLGLSLIEAMHLGMPVVALGATEAFRAVPPDAGAVSADLGELAATVRLLIRDPHEAARRGRIAREAALERYGLARFLADWDQVLGDAVARTAPRRTPLRDRGSTGLVEEEEGSR